MKKIISLAFLIAIVTTACEDTRRVMHQEYQEFVAGLDSLEAVRENTAMLHETIKEDNRTLIERVKDMEETDSSALEDLKQHQDLLQQQKDMLSTIKQIINERVELRSEFNKDSITVEEFEKQIRAMEINNQEISQKLQEIKTELKNIEEQQEKLNPKTDKTH